MSDESTPLLRDFAEASGPDDDLSRDHHTQFCRLIGTRPLTLAEDQKHKPHAESLYYRATRQRRQQHMSYVFTATLTNTLIMSQIVLGAALTGLGASNASGVLVTIFGALNTVIAGAIAFLKSRGQPMRSRMFRDDLERVVDEIENSAIMWLGISKNVHGYDAIDTEDQVTVRSEVARLTRLYDRAVKTNTLNDPDNYQMGGPSDPHSAELRGKSALPVAAAPPPSAPVPGTTSSGPDPAAPAAVPEDPDASPATKPPEPVKSTEVESPAPESSDATEVVSSPDGGKDATDPSSEISDQTTKSQPSSSDEQRSTSETPAPTTPAPTATPMPTSTPAAPVDPDESPASAVHPEKHTQDTSTS